MKNVLINKHVNAISELFEFCYANTLVYRRYYRLSIIAIFRWFGRPRVVFW